MDEFDLLNAAAREKERQHLQAILDRQAHTGTAETTSPAIPTGDEFADRGNYDDALATYAKEITLCEARLAVNSKDNVAQKALMRAIAHVGLLADRLVFAGEFKRARKCADQAIAYGVEALAGGIEANLTWIELVGAHANMFLNNLGPAQEFYLKFQSDKRNTLTSWETVILQDFEHLRRAGHPHPLMAKIERKLGDAGWTAQGQRSKKAKVSEMSCDNQYFVIMNPNDVKTAVANDRSLPPGNVIQTNVRVAETPQPDDIASGDRLFEEGNIDKALDVYRRRIKICQAKLTVCPNLQASEDLQIAVDRISDVAFWFILIEHNFPKALDLADEAIRMLENSAWPKLRRAHSLIMLDRPDEARAIYRGYRLGKAAPGRTWQSVVREEFAAMREHGLLNDLMDEIEKELMDQA